MASEDGAIIVLAEVWGGSRPLVGTKVRLTMARTTKRQKVATVEPCSIPTSCFSWLPCWTRGIFARWR